MRGASSLAQPLRDDQGWRGVRELDVSKQRGGLCRPRPCRERSATERAQRRPRHVARDSSLCSAFLLTRTHLGSATTETLRHPSCRPPGCSPPASTPLRRPLRSAAWAAPPSPRRWLGFANKLLQQGFGLAGLARGPARSAACAAAAAAASAAPVQGPCWSFIHSFTALRQPKSQPCWSPSPHVSADRAGDHGRRWRHGRRGCAELGRGQRRRRGAVVGRCVAGAAASVPTSSGGPERWLAAACLVPACVCQPSTLHRRPLPLHPIIQQARSSSGSACTATCRPPSARLWPTERMSSTRGRRRSRRGRATRSTWRRPLPRAAAPRHSRLAAASPVGEMRLRGRVWGGTAGAAAAVLLPSTGACIPFLPCPLACSARLRHVCERADAGE